MIRDRVGWESDASGEDVTCVHLQSVPAWNDACSRVSSALRVSVSITGINVSKPPTTLSSVDLSILSAVQENAARTTESLAADAMTSVSTAQRRLQRLRETGVIEREVAVLNPKALGVPLTLIVELEVERDRPELLPALHSWLSGAAEVQSGWQVTGRGDYLLVVLAASVESFDEFMAELMAANRNVRKFSTSLALKTLKRTMSVPLFRHLR
ncbi:MAG TPA: Lrp/AsnC family transcriptional regulator [Microvirga sp.]|nr:Lrp/AsnC family transcriptional regulator [Microvirga sp.]